MTSNRSVPELLAPAGSPESLRAALAGGADAVYFGAPVFSNRMRARNFTTEEISDAIELCHRCGAKVHVTVNIRIRDREFSEALELVDFLYSGSPLTWPDALIVADIGLAAEIKKRHPSAVLHASTQTSLSSFSDCKCLYDAGFSRIVLPRELSLGEISSLTSSLEKFETEIFVHGALCVSFSGQCLMSFVQGGRSGNRGECAQPCRLPFSTEQGERSEILSLSDLCLAGRITDVINSGVTSLKIEGRLRDPSYVYTVTKTYRRLLDERRNAGPDELKILSGAFNRGFTSGYFDRSYGNMSAKPSGAVQTDLKKVIDSDFSKRFEKNKSKEPEGTIPLTALFILKNDSPSYLSLSFKGDGRISTSVEGAVPKKATGNPVTEDFVKSCLIKCGGTGFSIDTADIECRIEPGLWMSKSEINALRRDAVSSLVSEMENRRTVIETENIVPDKSLETRETRSCEITDVHSFFSDPEGLNTFFDSFDRIIVPSLYAADFIAEATRLGVSPDTKKIHASLPVITPDDRLTSRLLTSLRSLGIGSVLCHTPGQVALAHGEGMKAGISFRANITNTPSLLYYSSLGCEYIFLSPELPAGAVRALSESSGTETGCIAYGRFPCMTLSRCIICGGKCKKGNIGGRTALFASRSHECRKELTDRKGEIFPVIADGDCTNIIYNSTPVWMGDRLNELKPSHGKYFLHYLFTVETCKEAVKITEQYSRSLPGTGRRI